MIKKVLNLFKLTRFDMWDRTEGLRQVGALSPILFVMTVDDVSKEIKQDINI